MPSPVIKRPNGEGGREGGREGEESIKGGEGEGLPINK